MKQHALADDRRRRIHMRRSSWMYRASREFASIWSRRFLLPDPHPWGKSSEAGLAIGSVKVPDNLTEGPMYKGLGRNGY